MRGLVLLTVGLLLIGCRSAYVPAVPAQVRRAAPVAPVLPLAAATSDPLPDGKAVGAATQITGSQLSNITVWDMGQQSPYAVDRKNATIRWTDWCSLMNRTLLELKSVTVQFKVIEVETKQVLIAGKPIKLTTFHNDLFPAHGSLLPEDIGTVRDLKFSFPLDDWRTDTRVVLDVVSAEAYSGPQDLHNGDHLFSFIFREYPPKTIALFKAHPDLVKVKNSQNATALFMAVAYQNVAVVKYLESIGGVMGGKTKGGATVMHMAARNQSDPEMLDYVLSRGGKVDEPDNVGVTPLDIAAYTGPVPAIPWFVKHGATVNHTDGAGHPPMYYAILLGRADAAEALFAAGADPHFHDRDGIGLLHYATSLGSLQALMAKHGVSIDDEVGPRHMTPLMMMAESGLGDSTIWLLEHGADPYRKDAHGENCFDLARKSNTLNTDRFFRAEYDKYWVHAKAP